MTFFLDTSALIKRYLSETGSSWMRELTDSAAGHLFIASRLATIEISSAFARRLREGTVTKIEYTDHVNAFTEDCAMLYHLVELEDDTFNLARNLIERHPLRTLDAIQLASAIVANHLFVSLNLPALVFISADDRLLQIAQQENLETDNPAHHP